VRTESRHDGAHWEPSPSKYTRSTAPDERASIPRTLGRELAHHLLPGPTSCGNVDEREAAVKRGRRYKIAVEWFVE
jgi:hypothetical protein